MNIARYVKVSRGKTWIVLADANAIEVYNSTELRFVHLEDCNGLLGRCVERSSIQKIIPLLV